MSRSLNIHFISFSTSWKSWNNDIVLGLCQFPIHLDSRLISPAPARVLWPFSLLVPHTAKSTLKSLGLAEYKKKGYGAGRSQSSAITSFWKGWETMGFQILYFRKKCKIGVQQYFHTFCRFAKEARFVRLGGIQISFHQKTTHRGPPVIDRPHAWGWGKGVNLLQSQATHLQTVNSRLFECIFFWCND